MPLDKSLDSASIEAKFQKVWEDNKLFACDPSSDKTPYTIMMPPPNVTGTLHIGHGLTMTLQDVLIRYHRMQGFDALWQPGTDHASIAVSNIIDRKLDDEGTSKDEVGREEYLKRAWAWKEESGSTITSQLRALGSSTDWDRERFTMDEGLSDAVLEIFVRMYKDGLIYKDNRLVNWDVKLQTSISDLEVEEKEVNGKLWYFRYPVKDSDEFVVVATTRPETMLGDSGVAVHPDDERYKHLHGKSVVLPLVGREIPIMPDPYPDPEKGTGAVKITPAHDFNDYEVGKRQGWEAINIFDKTACINENAPEKYRGLERFEARKQVVADMEALGLLEKIEDNVHMVPHGDRSKSIIEPFMTEQWYVDAKTLAAPAIEAVEKGYTTVFPANEEKVYFHWMRNIEPWCISRQLWWGHQIPAWYGPDNKVFVAKTEAQAQAEADAHYGQPTELRQDPDVLDTWFSSGLWPFSTLGWPEETPELARYYPGDVLVTGRDIIFFWVARMMMMGIYHADPSKPLAERVPFKKLYVHTLVRDEHGQKMSKSLGNVINPLDIIQQYSCDALRFTMASLAAPGKDIKLAEKTVETNRNFTTKLWNSTRFAEMNQASAPTDFDPSSPANALNKWMVEKMATATQAVAAGIESFRFHDAASALYHFIYDEFCDWYIELSKPIFYGEDQALIAETRATMAWTLKQIVHLAHPMMPFVTEELWEQFVGPANGADVTGGQGRLITGAWPKIDMAASEASAEIDWLIALITEVRSARAELNVPAGAQVRLLVADASAETHARIQRQLPLLSRLARVEALETLTGEAPTLAANVVLGEATYYMPLEGVIDIDAERARLDKDIAKADKQAAGLRGRLSNDAFLAKAPADVVAKGQSELAELDERLVGLRSARERLG